MRQSQLFTKARREAPSDEVAKNAQLLVRAGYVSKEMAGVYNFLPLGLRVLEKIIQIIREEMNAIGGQEILMSALQRRELWEKTGRWDDANIDSWFKTSLKQDADPDGTRAEDTGLAFTHEEPITNMMEQFLPSYKDLPKYVYQFQTKFRNEKRAKSGILRTREFIMKDLYSFSKNEAEHNTFYNKMKDAYKHIFDKVGIKTYLTRASGGSFSKFSHEFQTVCDAGEDTIYVSPGLDIAVNEEIVNESDVFKDLPARSNFTPTKSIEVGNIFTLGTRFSKALHCRFKDENGQEIYPFMGSYGIGPARLMGTIVEVLADERGLVWPKAVAPFSYHLVSIGQDKMADELYEELTKKGVSVLYDDRDMSAGQKFAESDLLGIPKRIVVGRDAASGIFEVALRATGMMTKVSREKLLALLS